MRKPLLALAGIIFATCVLATMGVAQAPDNPTMYIDANSEFQTALTAAMIKKHVPIAVTTDKGKADFILQSAPVFSKSESGGSKFTRCMFLDCIGINGYSSVSVELLKSSDSTVVWAYQVRKGNSGPLGVQSLSEAIAKHLKNDYLKKLK